MFMYEKITVLIAVIVLSHMATQGQNINTVDSYNKTVHEANIQLCLHHYDRAKKCFDSAFLIAQPFFTDLNNALVVETLQDQPDTARIIHYLEQIQRKGICVHDKYRKRTTVIPFLRLIEEKDCNTIRDEQVKAIVDTAIARDQAIRNYALEKYKDVYPKAMLPEINRVDSINFFQIDSMLRTLAMGNILIEDVMGTETFYSCMTVLLHNVAWGRDDTGLLISLAQKGLAESAYIALNLDDYCGITRFSDQQPECPGFGYYGTCACTITLRNAYILIPEKNKYEAITRNRRKLFLPDVIEEAKIRAFIAFNLKQGFDYGGINWVWVPEKEEKEFEDELRSRNKNIIKYENGKDFDFNREH